MEQFLPAVRWGTSACPAGTLRSVQRSEPPVASKRGGRDRLRGGTEAKTGLRTMEAGRKTAQAVLRTGHLIKHYGAVAALEDLDLEVTAGEVLDCLGPNGAGKPNTGL